MGIKMLKERFEIEHLVQKCDGYIAIGSPYIHDLIRITPDAVVSSRDRFKPGSDLKRYWDALTQAQATGELQWIIDEPDEIGPVVPVWTYSRGRVQKKWCETPGWPNTTTDGLMMYENAFFPSRSEALKRCRSSAVLWITSTWRHRIVSDFLTLAKGLKMLLRECVALIRAYLFFGLL